MNPIIASKMRSFLRVPVLVACVVVFMLYIVWAHPSLQIGTKVHQASPRLSTRLVVFGDDWSDTGIYKTPPHPPLERDEERGQSWAESLCKELVCDYIDNFAQSISGSGENRTVALVDNDRSSNSTGLPADLKTQVRQWINLEKQKTVIPSRGSKNEHTIFTMFFGLWDLLDYVHMKEEDARRAVDSTIMEMFRQLDVVVENARFPVRIILPLMADLSLLPGFRVHAVNSSSGLSLAQMQHHAVYLSTYWNTVLTRAAIHWDGGDVLMPDMNAFLEKHMRMGQLWALNVSDASGAGYQQPLFDVVEGPCLSQPKLLSKSDLSSYKINGSAPTDLQRCKELGRHLFWDEMHLSGKAMRLFGYEVAELVRGNQTVNEEARDRHGAFQASEGEELELEFQLLLPPERLG